MDSLKQNTYHNTMELNFKLTKKGKLFLNDQNNSELGFLEQIT